MVKSKLDDNKDDNIFEKSVLKLSFKSCSTFNKNPKTDMGVQREGQRCKTL